MAGGLWSFFLCKSQRDVVINYIKNQEEHHIKQSFEQEYLELLEKFEIPFDERYIFEFYD